MKSSGQPNNKIPSSTQATLISRCSARQGARRLLSLCLCLGSVCDYSVSVDSSLAPRACSFKLSIAIRCECDNCFNHDIPWPRL
eukprot:448071-Amphidinium_carterae.1